MWTERQPVDHGEHAGVDANANGERQDDHSRQQWVAEDEPEGIADIFESGFEQQRRMASIALHLTDPLLRQQAAGCYQSRVREQIVPGARRGGSRLALRPARWLQIQGQNRGLGRLLIAESAFGPDLAPGAPQLPPDERQERGDRQKSGGLA